MLCYDSCLNDIVKVMSQIFGDISNAKVCPDTKTSFYADIYVNNYLHA